MTNLDRIEVVRKSGSEQFRDGTRELEFDLLDFWRWSASDLVSNATRGVIAEYIVARALGIDTAAVRDEWAAYDLETAAGVKIEVKSAAYLQSWFQKYYSKISFVVRSTRNWDPSTNRQSGKPSRQAHVYVFALLSHKKKETVDPMDVSQWHFFVLPTSVINARSRSQHSITLSSLRRLCGDPLTFDRLSDGVEEAAERNR